MLCSASREPQLNFLREFQFSKPPSIRRASGQTSKRRQRREYDRQNRVLGKLRDITEDATDYYNDHGEHALFLGFPCISLPSSNERQGLKNSRVFAPALLVPVNLRVRKGAGAGVTIETAGTGADLVQPNPGLLAWIEQQTGTSTESLFADDAGEEPWREITEVLDLLKKAMKLPENAAFDASTLLQSVPKTEDLPPTAALLPCAVIGLFPLVNPGLMRDTKWMQENETSLSNPVKPFLAIDALAEPEEIILPEAKEWDHADVQSQNGHKDFADELLVTHADPCQAQAVASARHSAALVVHGPPGTGKSQTIANIIGDHLARGERVLFVCDKRTALDVVKYRLDSMGLGNLCGVIHDPQRDRRDFYLRLRDRLENLSQDESIADPGRTLAEVNQRLNSLHRELRDYFDQLQSSAGADYSFHHLCGEWLAARKDAVIDLPQADGLTLEMLQTHRTDAEEVINRGLNARWFQNPYRERIGMKIGDWLASSPASIRAALEKATQTATVVDEISDENLVPLDSNYPVVEQASARKELANALGAIGQRALGEVALRLVNDGNWARWKTESAKLNEGPGTGAEVLGKPLERDLFLQVKDRIPTLGDCSRHLIALDHWLAMATSLKRFFAFGAKKAAAEALAPLALELAPDNVSRAKFFYTGLKARYLWADLRDQLLGTQSPSLPADDMLLNFRDGLAEFITLLEIATRPANASLFGYVQAVLGDISTQAEGFAANLQYSAQRAQAIHALEQSLSATGLFTEQAINALSADWRANAPALEGCQSFVAYSDTLDDVIRLADRIKAVPGQLKMALGGVLSQGVAWEEAEPTLRAAALSQAIRQRLAKDESLARIDTQRVEAAFSELSDRSAQKTKLVRQRILHHWQERWRSRLCASTGSRLNQLGASLRQRLYVRGQKAMKLRQMIAAGSNTDGGDPLFDFCPVWMASPATVAQIFPRLQLFDVIVFDEASQCRLEEALPVMLRGYRVVIAGDPKQLPPTRFFEQSLTESDDTGAETAEEVFVQQQSEAEDLLSAALNLNVNEAFLDVHYRSRNEALIGFSNDAFYNGRLQPIPGHPRNKAFQAPIRLVRVDGVYQDRGNQAEAEAAAKLVAELLDDPAPPSIGIACFNLNQRDLILDALEQKAAQDRTFAERLDAARRRKGEDSFEGLFVKNLENVQGDERDHMIISTTFGPDPQNKFRRNFGALSRIGGERRLNVLVTRARSMVHVLTSIPRLEYLAVEPLGEGQRLTGRHHLYAYLRYAERLQEIFEKWQTEIETAKAENHAQCNVLQTGRRSLVAEALGQQLSDDQKIGSTVYWGNDGFCVDVALTHPLLPFDVTIGLLADFTRYLKTPDPIAWEQFRSIVLQSQGWQLHRLWSPTLFRDPDGQMEVICRRHREAVVGNQDAKNLDVGAKPSPDLI
ncbi:MAG: AAA domain-containing protein [Chthoniobacteraceae bacterium]